MHPFIIRGIVKYCKEFILSAFCSKFSFLLSLKVKSFTIFNTFYVLRIFYFFCLIFGTGTCIFQVLDTNLSESL